MKIDHYSFGKITIDGKTYTSDVIIYPDKVNASWWRKEGHSLYVEDLKEVLNAKPQVLVIGAGSFGVMKVPKETIYNLEANGIEVHIAKTGEAVELYNKLRRNRVVIAAFHLTC